jgi:hypothetical protein
VLRGRGGRSIGCSSRRSLTRRRRSCPTLRGDFSRLDCAVTLRHPHRAQTRPGSRRHRSPHREVRRPACRQERSEPRNPERQAHSQVTYPRLCPTPFAPRQPTTRSGGAARMLARPRQPRKRVTRSVQAPFVNSMCDQNEAQGTCHERKNLTLPRAFIGPSRLPGYRRVT